MIKLYEKNSFLKENDAYVTFSEGDVIQLDETVFFPEEGGQYADTGVLKVLMLPDGETGNLMVGDEINLIDGQIKKGEIYYTVSRAIPLGTKVHCILDWDKRFDRMQNHSGEHVLTGTIHNKYGYNNVGFHLSDDALVTLDFDGVLSYDEVIEMEKLANMAVYNNLPIKDSYPTKEELSEMTYRSKIEIDGQVRIITVGDDDQTVDVCACCAPHVATTGQIGIIKVVSVINYKKGIRVSILCGRRALQYINNEHSIMTSLSRTLTTAPESVEDVVKSHMEEIGELKLRISSLIEGKLLEQIDKMPLDKEGVLFTKEDLSVANVKKIFNTLCDKFEGYVGIFCGSDEKGYRFSAGSSNKDSKELGNMMREKLSAKGGGSSEMVQGRVEAPELAIREFFSKL